MSRASRKIYGQLETSPAELKLLDNILIYSNGNLYGELKDITPLYAFHTANASNLTYFRSKAKEDKVATFIREVLIKDPFLNEGRRAAQTTEYIRERYKKKFDRKTVAKALERAFESKLLKREDRTGEQSVYYYSLIIPLEGT